MICFRCSKEIPGGIKDLFKHLKYVHRLHSGSATFIVCRQGGCCDTFSHISSYKRHICVEHTSSTCSLPSVDNENAPVGSEAAECFLELDDTGSQNSDIEDEQSQDGELKDDILDATSFFIASIKATAVPYSMVQQIVYETEELMKKIVTNLQSKLESTIQKRRKSVDFDIDNCFDELQQQFELAKGPFNQLRTQRQQDNYFKSKGVYISPEDVTVGK